MMIRLAILPLILALNFSMCKRHESVANSQQVSSSPTSATTTAGGSPGPGLAGAAPSPKITKPVVDQTAQTLIFCYHGLVEKVRFPGTQITPAAFEAQMKELKDRGITVIGMQDLLAWKRGEKNIPPRCAVISFDDGLKSQYEVAWPIMKKFGYTFTMFIYTEGVRGGLFGGGEAIGHSPGFTGGPSGYDQGARWKEGEKTPDWFRVRPIPPKRTGWVQAAARTAARDQSELLCSAVRILQ
jgi:hypothetical protein